tara:strand:+ start:769 stop:1017 length:249 start_codon:yes stop_codon:yes gene_type:complete
MSIKINHSPKELLPLNRNTIETGSWFMFDGAIHLVLRWHVGNKKADILIFDPTWNIPQLTIFTEDKNKLYTLLDEPEIVLNF